MTPLSHETLIRHLNDATSLSVVGTGVHLLADAEATNGAYTAWVNDVPAGFGPPPHLHANEDEAFYVMEGTFTISCDGREWTVGPGTLAHLPRGKAHAFRNSGTDPGRLLCWSTPAGMGAFFQAFAALGTPPPMAEAIAVGARHGITFLPPTE